MQVRLIVVTAQVFGGDFDLVRMNWSFPQTLWEVKTLRLSENASVDLVTCTLRMSVFTPDE